LWKSRLEFIAGGADFESGRTYVNDRPTDIPEDFYCTPEVSVTIPANATHLFVCASDVYHSDNSDPEDDFGVEIWNEARDQE